MKIIVAATFEGLDRTTRLWHVLEHLEQQGHTVAIAGSGRGFGAVAERFERTFSVHYKRAFTPEEQQDLDWQLNRLLNERLKQFQPDVMILDSEPFSTRLAQWLNIPVICIDHEHIFQHSRLDLHIPPAQRNLLSQRKERLKQRKIRADRFLLPVFFEPIISSEFVLSAGPITRKEMAGLTPSHEGPFIAFTWPHILADIDVFSTCDIPLEAHVAMRKIRAEGEREQVKWEHEIKGSGGNLRRRRKEQLPKEFDEDELVQKLPEDGRGITYQVAAPETWLPALAGAQAALMDGELTGIAEAIALQTPMLLVPHPRRFDQWCFAQYVEKMGFGEAHPKLTRAVLEGFVQRLDRYRENLAAHAEGPQKTPFLELLDSSIATYEGRQEREREERAQRKQASRDRNERPRQGQGPRDRRERPRHGKGPRDRDQRPQRDGDQRPRRDRDQRPRRDGDQRPRRDGDQRPRRDKGKD